LGKILNRQGYTLVLPWANTTEHLRAESIASALTKAVVLPKLGLTKLGSVIANAKAAIGVDTGLIHLAVAFNIPSIAMYTDTHPALNGAYASQNSMAINLGGKNNSPTVSEVLNALNSLNLTK
jgi:heptosyltransferase-1